MTGDGRLPPRRLDQVRQPATPSLQPGSSQVVRARFVIVSGSGGGVFVYGGAGPGGLLVSVTDVTEDPFGNPVHAGAWVYGEDGAAVGLAVTTNQPGLQLAPPSSAHSTQRAEVFADTGNAGAANEYQYMVLTSGEENGLTDAALQLFSESADGTGAAHAVFEFGGAVAGTFDAEGYAPEAPWTALTLENGWALHAPNVGPCYRQVLADTYQIIGVIDGSSATASQFATLPFNPVWQQGVCAAMATTFAGAYVLCDTSGNLTLNAASFAHVYIINGFVRAT